MLKDRSHLRYQPLFIFKAYPNSRCLIPSLSTKEFFTLYSPRNSIPAYKVKIKSDCAAVLKSSLAFWCFLPIKLGKLKDVWCRCGRVRSNHERLCDRNRRYYVNNQGAGYAEFRVQTQDKHGTLQFDFHISRSSRQANSHIGDGTSAYRSSKHC